MLQSRSLELVPEHMIPLNDRNLSSFSDVEILEQFDVKKNGGSEGETSSPPSEKMVHVHFEDLNTSQGEVDDTITYQEVLKEHSGKECVVQPNQFGSGSGSVDSRGLMRSSGSSGKQAQRSGKHCAVENNINNSHHHKAVAAEVRDGA